MFSDTRFSLFYFSLPPELLPPSFSRHCGMGCCAESIINPFESYSPLNLFAKIRVLDNRQLLTKIITSHIWKNSLLAAPQHRGYTRLSSNPGFWSLKLKLHWVSDNNSSDRYQVKYYYFVFLPSAFNINYLKGDELFINFYIKKIFLSVFFHFLYYETIKMHSSRQVPLIFQFVLILFSSYII